MVGILAKAGGVQFLAGMPPVLNWIMDQPIVEALGTMVFTLMNTLKVIVPLYIDIESEIGNL